MPAAPGGGCRCTHFVQRVCYRLARPSRHSVAGHQQHPLLLQKSGEHAHRVVQPASRPDSADGAAESGWEFELWGAGGGKRGGSSGEPRRGWGRAAWATQTEGHTETPGRRRPMARVNPATRPGSVMAAAPPTAECVLNPRRVRVRAGGWGDSPGRVRARPLTGAGNGTPAAAHPVLRPTRGPVLWLWQWRVWRTATATVPR